MTSFAISLIALAAIATSAASLRRTGRLSAAGYWTLVGVFAAAAALTGALALHNARG